MEKLPINTYDFKELSPEVAKRALEELVIDIDDWNALQHILNDDDALLEPKHEDLVKVFGENYKKKFKNGFLINNNHDIKFDTDYNYIDISNAMKIDDDKLFFEYLGIPHDLMDKISYEILATETRFYNHTGLTENENKILDNADENFSLLVDEIAKRVDLAYIKLKGIKFSKSGEIIF